MADKPTEKCLLTQEDMQIAVMGLHDKGITYCLEVIRGYQEIKFAKAIPIIQDAEREKALIIVRKYWSQYCDIKDNRSCLETLKEIYDGIEALKDGE